MNLLIIHYDTSRQKFKDGKVNIYNMNKKENFGYQLSTSILWGHIMKKICNIKGFSLIELIVVLAVLAIIALIGVPRFLTVMSQSKVNADLASVNALNKATELYAVINKIPMNQDVFEGIETDEARMQTLVDAGKLGKVYEPQMQGEAFEWHVELQSWFYSYFEIAEASYGTYVFKDLADAMSGYRKTGTWRFEEDEGFASTHGLLFIENANEAYQIKSSAVLSDDDDDGGYGILFETTLTDENEDTGYALQFDRGLNAIVIRPRTNGGEGSSIITINHSRNELIPDDRTSEWWTQEHDITIEVQPVSGDATRKTVSVLIDDVQIINQFEIDSHVEDPNLNFSGFRSWHEETIYKELEIISLD
jgi:prepilin-type N-terminal cleavage/methylation domain-containing protein